MRFAYAVKTHRPSLADLERAGYRLTRDAADYPASEETP